MPSALRLVALGLATLAGLAAVAIAGFRLQQGPSVPPAPPPAPAARAADPPPSTPDDDAWPALFGTAPPAAEAPAAPPKPAGSYALRGIVAGRGGGWAILADAGREVLVRPGDEIEPGWTVARIAADRVLIASGDTEVAIGFAEGEQVRTVEVAAGDAAGADGDAGADDEPDDPEEIRPAQEVRTPVASPTELRDMILRAEAERIARGLAAPARDIQDR